MPDRVRLAGLGRQWTAERRADAVHLLEPDETVWVTAATDRRWLARVHSSAFRGAAVRHGDEVWVTIDGHVFVFTAGRQAEGGRTIESDALAVPMPATVVRIDAAPGQAVRRGDLLVALEAMKMELTIRAPRDGIVAAVRCREGELVAPGRPIVELQ